MTTSKRMKLSAIVCLLILSASMMAGCIGKAPDGGESNGTDVTNSNAEGIGSEQPVFFSVLDSMSEGGSEGITEVQALYRDMSDAWSVKTDPYPMTELSGSFDIGAGDKGYYVEAGGTIYCYSIADGELLWRVDDFGAVTASAFDDEGNLYACGYYTPVLGVISPDGEVIQKYTEFSFTDSGEDPSGFYWPVALRLDGDRVKIQFDSNGRTISLDPANGTAELLPEGSGAGIADAVPELAGFMGCWGYLEGGDTASEANVVEVTDSNGKLKVDFAAIPGGGCYVLFDEEDISFGGGSMICRNGLIVAEGQRLLDGSLVVTPSDGGCTFVLSNDGGEWPSQMQDKFVYKRVADTHEELMDWVHDHVENL